MPKDIEEDNELNPGTVTVRKTITLLRSPKATFVSLVPNGANQRPFRVLKSASGKRKVGKNKNSRNLTNKPGKHPGPRVKAILSRVQALSDKLNRGSRRSRSGVSHSDGIDRLSSKLNRRGFLLTLDGSKWGLGNSKREQLAQRDSDKVYGHKRSRALRSARFRKMDMSSQDLTAGKKESAGMPKKKFQREKIAKTLFAEGHTILAYRGDSVIYKHAETGEVLVRKGFGKKIKVFAKKVGRAVATKTKKLVVRAKKAIRSAGKAYTKSKANKAKAARSALRNLPDSHKTKIRNKLNNMVMEHTMETIDRSHRRGTKAPALKSKKLLAGLHEYDKALGPVRVAGKKKAKKKAVAKKPKNVIAFKQPAAKKAVKKKAKATGTAGFGNYLKKKRAV